MSNCEWKAIDRDHARHIERVHVEGVIHVNVIRVANLNTEREQKVVMCEAFCPVCNAFLRALMYRKTSPLNRLQEKMPLVADRHEAPTPS